MNLSFRGIAFSVCLLSISGGAFADTVYGVGASWTSNGPDAPGTTGGDSRHADGDVWLEIATSTIGIPKPISSSETPASSAETATNFARGGANISATSGTGGVDRPYDAGEQLVNLGTYLTDNSITLDDTHTLTFSAGGMGANDLLDQIDINPLGINTAFITTLVNDTVTDINAAVGLGFSAIFILNMPDIASLPGAMAVMSPTELSAIDTAVTGYNSGLASAIATLQSNNSGVEFVSVDLYSLIDDVQANPVTYNFNADATTVLFTDGDVPGTATGADPATTAWWDPLHPSSALHALIADAAITAGDTGGAGGAGGAGGSSSSGGGGGSIDMWMIIFLLTIMVGMVTPIRRAKNA